MSRILFKRIRGRIIPILNKGQTDFAAKTALKSLETRAAKNYLVFEAKLGAKKAVDTIYLDKLVVPPTVRNSGYGSMYLKKLTKIADKFKKRVFVTGAKGGWNGSDPSKLPNFYKKNGFTSIGDRWFHRDPK